jgi:hypothetical protein
MTLVTKKVESYWNHGGVHDKVYRLEMQESKGRYDVIGLYGRRGKNLNMHVIRAGVDEWDALVGFGGKQEDLLKKGYAVVNEDVAETNLLTFKVF